MLSRTVKLSLIISLALVAGYGSSCAVANQDSSQQTLAEFGQDDPRKAASIPQTSSGWTYQVPTGDAIAVIRESNICNSFSGYKIPFNRFTTEIESKSEILKSISGTYLVINWRGKNIAISNGYTVTRAKGYGNGSSETGNAPLPVSEFRAMYVHDGAVKRQITQDDNLYGIFGTLLDPLPQKQEVKYDRERARILSEILSPLLYLFIVEFEPDHPENLHGPAAEFFRSEVSNFGPSFQYFINPNGLIESDHKYLPESRASFREFMSSVEIAQISSDAYAIRYAKSNPMKIALIDEKLSDAFYFICPNSQEGVLNDTQTN